MADIFKKFPELTGLDKAEAERVCKETQRRITRQPMIFIGMIATLAIVGILIYKFSPALLLLGPGLIGALFDGALIGVAAVLYLKLVIEPKMRAEFRQLNASKTR